MRGHGSWAGRMLLALGVCCAASVLRAEDVKPEEKPGWFQRWFMPKKKADPKKTAQDKKREQQAELAKLQAQAKQAADERRREEANYLRRLQVCEQLMQVACEKQDENLQRQAEQLEDRVLESYQKRSSEAISAVQSCATEEDVLKQKLGAKESGQSLRAAKTPTAPRDAQASRKEDKR